MADDDDAIPLDDELEAEFDSQEAPTKPDASYHCVPAKDFKELLAAVVVIERFYAVAPGVYRDSKELAKHIASMERLCLVYGVKR